MNIPKKLHLTCKDKNNITNPVWQICLEKYKSMYSNYEIIIHDNEDIYKIIEKNFPEYLEKIKQIKIGAVLADIFRYLILYLEGGVYSDLDCEPIKSVDELLNPDFKYYHGDKDRDNNFYIYKSEQRLVNKQWDFYDNICDNSDFINLSNTVLNRKCLGHEMGNVSTILSYEFHSDYIKNIKTNTIMNSIHPATKKYGHQICQWFMISEPKQEVFLNMFLSIMVHLDNLVNIRKDDEEYLKKVIEITGPSGFTEIVEQNMSEKIKVLPSDFFCCKSWNGAVPRTRNSYIQHHFTGSWH